MTSPLPAPAPPRRPAPRVITLVLLAALGLAAGWGVIRFFQESARAAGLAFLRARAETLSIMAGAAEKQAALLRKQAAQARIALFRELEREASELRGLPFKHDVRYEILDRSQIKDTLRALIRQQHPPEAVRRYGAMLAALGLLPAGYDLEEAYLTIMGEQVAGLYDLLNQRLVMFREADPRAFPTRMVLVHELVHALQDQHFNLRSMPLLLQDNDDRALAAAALIEGDAMLVMERFKERHMSPHIFGELLGGSLALPMKELQRAPRFLRVVLLFPYLKGAQFAARLYEEGGFEAVNRAYAEPPRSAAEILFPSLHGRIALREDWPAPEVPGLGAPLQNTLGAVGLRVWLDLWSAPGSARGTGSGWRGDRVLAYFGEDGAVHTAWLTEWFDGGEAQGFFKLARNAVLNRHEPGEPAAASEGLIEFNTPRAVRVEQRGETVLILDAATPESRDRIATALGDWHLATPAR